MSPTRSHKSLVFTDTGLNTYRRNIQAGGSIATRHSKSKAVPLHAIEAHGGRGGITPTHT
jgi:hypothetical protein